jgi:O-antigen/teichoic acid export membrane protein
MRVRGRRSIDPRTDPGFGPAAREPMPNETSPETASSPEAPTDVSRPANGITGAAQPVVVDHDVDETDDVVGDVADDVERSSLAHRTISGIRWGLVSTSADQILRVAFTVLIARLIGPDDFGVAAQAAVYVGLTGLFIDAGFGAALIQKREIDDDDVGSVFWLNVAVGLVAMAVTLLVAPWVANFFHTPELTAVLQVTSILVMINALAVVPTSLLNRQMGWRPIAITQAIGIFVGGVISVVAAVMGAGYWSIVIQNILIGLVTLIGLLLVTGVPPVRASWQRIRELWAFTWGLMGSRTLRYVNDNIDNVLVGRYLGTADLAFYALAFRLLKLPVRLLGALVNQVSLPAFSRMQDDKARMRRWFLVSTQTMATGTYPFLMLGILLTPYLIPLLFGPKWEPAVVPTQLLTAVAMRQMVLMLVGPLFQALGKTREQFGWTVVAVAATVVGIVIGLQWGIVGVAAGVAISMYALAPLQIAVAARLVGFQGREYTRALLPSWLAVGAMVAAWFVVQWAGNAIGIPTILVVTIGSIVAFAAYLGTLRFGFRSVYDGLHEIGMMVLARRGRRVATRAG